jgi:hypothetical protein
VCFSLIINSYQPVFGSVNCNSSKGFNFGSEFLEEIQRIEARFFGIGEDFIPHLY